MRVGSVMREKIAVGFYALFILALCATTTVLALEVKSLRPQADELRRRKAFPFVGQYLPTVRAATLQGDSVTVGETASGRSQVLIYFSPSCQYCREMLPEWKRISDALLADSARRFDVVWVSVSTEDSTRAYAESHQLTGTIVRMPSSKLHRVARIKAVPITLVLDRQGQVVHVHPSVFQTRLASDSVVAAAQLAAAVGTARRKAEPRGN